MHRPIKATSEQRTLFKLPSFPIIFLFWSSFYQPRRRAQNLLVMEGKFRSLEEAFLAFRDGKSAGSNDAIEFLFDKYNPGLILLADSLQPNSFRSLHVVNNSWRKAVRKRTTFQSRADLSAFLRRVVEMACIPPPFRLKPKKNEPLEKKEFPEFVLNESDAEDPYGFLIEKAIGLLGPLPFKTRKIFELFYNEGKTESEIARVLGMTKQVVVQKMQQVLNQGLPPLGNGPCPL